MTWPVLPSMSCTTSEKYLWRRFHSIRLYIQKPGHSLNQPYCSWETHVCKPTILNNDKLQKIDTRPLHTTYIHLVASSMSEKLCSGRTSDLHVTWPHRCESSSRHTALSFYLYTPSCIPLSSMSEKLCSGQTYFGRIWPLCDLDLDHTGARVVRDTPTCHFT